MDQDVQVKTPMTNIIYLHVYLDIVFLVRISNLMPKIRLDRLDPAPGGPASDLKANH